MIQDLKPYPAYKESGVPWLGAIPQHWSLQRLDRLFILRSEAPLEGDARVTGYLDGRVTLRSNVSGQKIKGVVKETGWQRVHPGDFAISGMNAHLGGMGVSDSLGKCSPIYLVLKPKVGTNAQFVSHAVRHAAHSGALKAMVNTIRFNSADFKRDDLKLIWVWIPTCPEQSAIVRFIGHADRRIRRYIGAKKKLIALLNEQKQAIIHRAVTRGLDPNVRLKPSGLECLGDVPIHWEVRRLRALVDRIEQGVSPQAEAGLAEDGTWGVLKSGCVNRGIFRDTEHKRLPPEFPVDPSLAVKIGDVLVSRACGSPSLVGSTGRITQLRYQLILSDKLFRPVFKNPRLSAFMVAAMNTRYYRVQVEGALSGADGLANNLPLSSLRDFKFAIPPELDAERIASFLREQTGHVDTAIISANREIVLLDEYRTRLIADVVTGKLDVRDAAAHLPDETNEPQALEDAESLADDDDAAADADPDNAAEEADA
jgi:type I restriction enzyme S subunit